MSKTLFPAPYFKIVTTNQYIEISSDPHPADLGAAGVPQPAQQEWQQLAEGAAQRPEARQRLPRSTQERQAG